MEIVVAEAAVSFAMESLGKLLVDKAVFLMGVKEDVKWVRGQLIWMQSFLKDAAKRQSDSEVIRTWISDVRKVAHDAEDAIELFVLNVQSRGKLEKCARFPIHLCHLNNVGKEILSIRQTLTEIEVSRRRWSDIRGDGNDRRAGPNKRTKSQEEVERLRRLDYWQKAKLVVGLDKDVELLLGKSVFGKSQGLSVAAILGMPGSGKSTLAQEIFNHTDVTRPFGQYRAWAVVSSEFNPEDVMKHILKQLGGISAEQLLLLGSINDNVGREEELKKEVHQRLTGNRYFIVLDDVWEAAHWESLSTAFPDEALGDNTSSDKCPEALKKVSEKILEKCDGLPLAISMVGGVLAKTKRSESEWEDVYKQMNSHLDRSSGDLNNMAAILELSYQNLPPELKPCFLCLGFFKEDAIIKVKELVHIWVAHGLVAQEERMEKVTRNYLTELISRNMVELKEMKYDEVTGCQMHDLIRDLSIRKAKEEIDFEVVTEKQNSNQSLAKPRHCAIYCSSKPNFIFSTNRHVRSLFIHFYQVGFPPYISGGPSSSWKSFELLRVLDLGNAKFQVLPKGIGELRGLRYLRMRYDGKPSMLPLSWAKLKNLEVLVIWGPYRLIKIDKVILKMESLCHLHVNVNSCEVGLGNMRKLKTLHLFRVDSSSSSDIWKIQGMSGVSKLGIDMLHSDERMGLFTCLSSLEDLSDLTLWQFWSLNSLDGLTSLHRIKRLKLHGYFLEELDQDGPVYFPPNLTHLTLSRMQLEEDVLEKLSKLLYLKLKSMTILGRKMVITRGGFPSLKVLHIKNMNSTCKMEIEESAMPELNQFIIRNCPNFGVENVPERIKSAILQAH